MDCCWKAVIHLFVSNDDIQVIPDVPTPRGVASGVKDGKVETTSPMERTPLVVKTDTNDNTGTKYVLLQSGMSPPPKFFYDDSSNGSIENMDLARVDATSYWGDQSSCSDEEISLWMTSPS